MRRLPCLCSSSSSSRHSPRRTTLFRRIVLSPTIAKAANPWSARRGAQSKKVFRTVKGILNKLTPEKYDLLLEQMMQAGISSAEILQGVISLIFDKAVLEPNFCSMYAQLCVNLSKELPEFPSEHAGEKP